MPVGKPIKPQKPKDLRAKILATQPGQEGTILRDVQSHLNKHGLASYQQTTTEKRDVYLTATSCIIFLIRGKFEYGWQTSKDEHGVEHRIPGKEVDEVGLGHPVQGEACIQLHEYTVVVIIDTD